MRFDILKMLYTNIWDFFLAAELKKKSSVVSRENTTNTTIICKPKLQKTNYLDSECFQMGHAVYSILSELVKSNCS